MNICIIGTGYVGLCSGVGLASKGHTVTCVDTIKEKVDMINNGTSPLYEEGLSTMLQDLVSQGTLRATTDISSAMKNAAAIFLSVGTPSDMEGNIDLRYITAAAEDIGTNLRERLDYPVIVIKSTVIPGTTATITTILEKASGKKAGIDFGVAVNPEFLREGHALHDFLQPDRIIIGESEIRAGDRVKEVYAHFDAPILRTTLETAEMIKYTANSLLATKISFSNEIGNLCKKLNINVNDVMKGVGLDHRLSQHFLQAGLGFGGSCFPKDVSALTALAKDSNMTTPLLQTVLDINKKQRFLILDLLEKRIGSLEGKTIALLGLAFKGGTDDVREAPSLDIITHLLKKNAQIKTYDPQASAHTQTLFPTLTYCKTPQEAVMNTDACLILTEWDEFSRLTDNDFSTMKTKVIIEGRTILNPKMVTGYEGICW